LQHWSKRTWQDFNSQSLLSAWQHYCNGGAKSYCGKVQSAGVGLGEDTAGSTLKGPNQKLARPILTFGVAACCC